LKRTRKTGGFVKSVAKSKQNLVAFALSDKITLLTVVKYKK
jgi:hypothetical protein